MYSLALALISPNPKLTPPNYFNHLIFLQSMATLHFAFGIDS